MAIKMPKTYQTGVTAEYHRISKVIVDYSSNMIQVEVLSYLTEETRRDNLQPIDRRMVQIPLRQDMDIRQGIYDIISAPLEPVERDERGNPMSPSVLPTGLNGGEQC